MSACYTPRHFVRPFPPPPGAQPRSVPQGGYLPAQLVKAYGLPKMTAVRPVKIGIMSLGGRISQADVAAFFAKAGVTVASVTETFTGGLTGLPPADPNGADVENALDVQWSAGTALSMLIGGTVSVVICYAPNSSTGIASSTQALLADGCDVISESWGSPKQGTDPASAVFASCVAAGVPVFGASGDNSADDGTRGLATDFPACDVNVVGVGGTSLQINADGSRLSEAAWGDGSAADEGGGGGYDMTQPTPSWQAGIAGMKGRGVPDVSSAADPNTGAAVYVGGQWQVIGGTSWAAPTWAGIVAAFKAAGYTVPCNLGKLLYGTAPTNDITTGSNGEPTAPGWDAATGLGSPNGPKLLAMFAGSSPAPVPPPAPTPTPTPTPPTPGPTPPVPPPAPVPVPPAPSNPDWTEVYPVLSGALNSLLLTYGMFGRPFHLPPTAVQQVVQKVEALYSVAAVHVVEEEHHVDADEDHECEITLEVTHRHD